MKKVTAHITEVWPFFYIQKPGWGGTEIELTQEEWAEYSDMKAKFDKWQILIRERAFPNTEDF